MMDKEALLDQKIKLGDEYRKTGKYLHALQIYHSVMNADSGNSEAVIKTAGLFSRSGKKKAAIRLLNDFLAEHADNKDVRFFLAELYLDLKNWKAAASELDKLDPAEEPEVLFFAGYAHFMLGEFELARKYLNDFLRCNHHTDLTFEAYYLSGKIEIRMNNYKSAVDYLKKAEPFKGNYPEFNYLTALSYFEMDMCAHASKYAERSISAANPSAESLKLAGKIYLKLGDYKNAGKNFQKYIDMGHSDADSLCQHAAAFLNSGKINDALVYYKKALASDSGYKPAIDGKRNVEELIKKKNRVSDE